MTDRGAHVIDIAQLGLDMLVSSFGEWLRAGAPSRCSGRPIRSSSAPAGADRLRPTATAVPNNID